MFVVVAEGCEGGGDLLISLILFEWHHFLNVFIKNKGLCKLDVIHFTKWRHAKVNQLLSNLYYTAYAKRSEWSTCSTVPTLVQTEVTAFTIYLDNFFWRMTFLNTAKTLVYVILHLSKIPVKLCHLLLKSGYHKIEVPSPPLPLTTILGKECKLAIYQSQAPLTI